MREKRDSDGGTGAAVCDCPFVSVIIAARDEAPWIDGCLAALAAQTYPRERFEVVLSDGCSTDGTPARAAATSGALGLPVTIVENERGSTPAGFNLGLDHARGDVVIILGARARPAGDFIAASVRALERTGADAVGGVVETRATGGGLVAGAVALAQRSPFGVGDAAYRYATREREVDTVNYGAYRRAAFERAGRFDEALQWVEDDELNYRLRAAGGRLVLDPAIRVVYLARPTLAALWRQRYRWGLNKPRVAERHPGQMRARHLVPAALVLALAGGAALWPLGRWARAPLIGVAGAYVAATMAATLRLGARHGWPRATVALPAAFAAMHLAYGAGTIAGGAALAARRLGSVAGGGEARGPRR